MQINIRDCKITHILGFHPQAGGSLCRLVKWLKIFGLTYMYNTCYSVLL